MIGRTLSHFRIVAKIGEGGMGVVYRAEDTKLRRQVALKVLPPDLVANEERRLRFLREARTAAAVNHPNIATIHEVDEADGVVFIAMELVEGKTLREHMGARPMAIKDSLRIATEMAEGLAKAHGAQVIHRDFKPDNVIVTTDGHVKILDFGLAKLLEDPHEDRRSEMSKLATISGEMTREGKIFGTAAYMSPEQARGQQVDARSDLFSFGTTLYEMVTGKVPFAGKTATDTLSSIIRDEPPPPSQLNDTVPLELDRIIAECLEKDPQDRYQHTDQLAVDLRKLKRITDSGVQAVRTPSGPVAVPPTVKGRWRKWAWIAALVAVLIPAGIAAWRAIRTPGAFESGDWVIVADFENSTDRRDFDTAIRDAFEAMLGQSTFLRVIKGQPLTDMVTKSGGTETSRIDRDLAERLCRDGDCAGYLIGGIEPEGTAFRLEAEIHRAGLRAPVAIQTAVAASEEDLLLTIHEMVLDLRQSLGERPQAVSETPPPTTRSVRAYQLLALSGRLELDKNEEMILVIKQALEIDPDFVDAYEYLANAYYNLGEFREFRKAAEESYRRSSGLPKQARLMTEINFLEASFQFDKEVERLKTYRRLYPFDMDAANYLGLVYNGVAFQDEISAETPYRDAYRLAPNSRNLANLLEVLWLQGKADEIERLVEDFRSKGGAEKHAAGALLILYTMRGDYQGLLEALDQYAREFDLTEADVINARMSALVQAGRLAEVEKALPLAWRQARKTQNVGWMYGLGLTEAWLRHRRDGLRPTLSAEQLKPARESLIYLPGLASWCLYMNLAEPLEEVIDEHERAEEGSTSRFVREELQFANGCLALIRGEVDRSRELLEPLARRSNLCRRHDALRKVYEALGMWREAADEYEEVLRSPRLKWGNAGPILDQFHLAQLYEKLGDTDRAVHWYESFTETWKDADPDIPELIEARKRLAELEGDSESKETTFH